eukprot:GHVT01102390.1.p1 GENE.GHVT01102390.1~~GHVT01102390.1.p1  ORF type:complete len:552 (+),score=47.24 GHVT01102390.1:401-2056(+)
MATAELTLDRHREGASDGVSGSTTRPRAGGLLLDGLLRSASLLGTSSSATESCTAINRLESVPDTRNANGLTESNAEARLAARREARAKALTGTSGLLGRVGGISPWSLPVSLSSSLLPSMRTNMRGAQQNAAGRNSLVSQSTSNLAALDGALKRTNLARASNSPSRTDAPELGKTLTNLPPDSNIQPRQTSARKGRAPRDSTDRDILALSPPVTGRPRDYGDRELRGSTSKTASRSKEFRAKAMARGIDRLSERESTELDVIAVADSQNAEYRKRLSSGDCVAESGPEGYTNEVLTVRDNDLSPARKRRPRARSTTGDEFDPGRELDGLLGGDDHKKIVGLMLGLERTNKRHRPTDTEKPVDTCTRGGACVKGSFEEDILPQARKLDGNVKPGVTFVKSFGSPDSAVGTGCGILFLAPGAIFGPVRNDHYMDMSVMKCEHRKLLIDAGVTKKTLTRCQKSDTIFVAPSDMYCIKNDSKDQEAYIFVVMTLPTDIDAANLCDSLDGFLVNPESDLFGADGILHENSGPSAEEKTHGKSADKHKSSRPNRRR